MDGAGLKERSTAFHPPTDPGRPPVAMARRAAAFAVRAASAAVLLASRGARGAPGYLRRFVLWGPPGAADWRRWPVRHVAASASPRPYADDPEARRCAGPLLREISVTVDGVRRTFPLEPLLAASGTTAFLVVRDGVLLQEAYYGGRARESTTRAFSITKSVTSALVGVALAEGRLGGVDDAFVRYLPELRGRGYDGITLRHLLRMTGGLRFTSGRFPWTDQPLLARHPDVRRVVLEGPPIAARPGERFIYSDYSTAVLAMVLERATGSSLAALLERALWQPMGAEHGASWTLDHEGTGLEYAHSGLNARPIDLVKLGSLYLDGGVRDGRRVLDAAWIEASVAPPGVDPPGFSEAERRTGTYYGLGWWGQRRQGRKPCFYAHGLLGQVVFVDPEKRVVVGRFGVSDGGVPGGWPMVLRAVADALPSTAGGTTATG